MTSLEEYVSDRLAYLLVATTNERDSYKEKGYFHQSVVTDIRKRSHELNMLCKYVIGNEDLISLSKKVYDRIVEIDESDADFY